MTDQILADQVDLSLQTIQRPKGARKPKPYGLRPKDTKTETSKKFGEINSKKKTNKELQERFDRITSRGPATQKNLESFKVTPA